MRCAISKSTKYLHKIGFENKLSQHIVLIIIIEIIDKYREELP